MVVAMETLQIIRSVLFLNFYSFHIEQIYLKYLIVEVGIIS